MTSHAMGNARMQPEPRPRMRDASSARTVAGRTVARSVAAVPRWRSSTGSLDGPTPARRTPRAIDSPSVTIGA